MKCPDHPYVPNTERTGSAVAIGSFADYACVEGYHQATLQLTCQEDETWSKHNFTCIKEGCRAPPTEPHASVSGGGGAIGTEHKYSCDAGFWISGERTSIVCQENETWSKAKFKCKALIDCPQPTPIQFATWIVPGTLKAEEKKLTRFKPKTRVEYRCKWQPKPGELSGGGRDYGEEDWDRQSDTGGQLWTASRTCQKDGKWTAVSRDLKCWPPAKKSTVLKYKKGYVRRFGDCTGRDLKRIYLESHDRRRSDKCFVECSRMTECRSFLFVVMTKYGTN
ncbi:sushi, von Willebrand factor type A, EGF and pentraxin domain-containing protein 1-like [Lineus longissimus]|uniref:sushi, von Willebrand factor type A, EGF and pentraxin domain-containing protein 1-like n=1 Tax=Lineus longissimus TaxID=88925 RepID=UPI00315CA814